MLNCSLLHHFSHHMHNYADTAFKTPGRLRSLICIHALYNTAVISGSESIISVFCIASALFFYTISSCAIPFIYSAKCIFIFITWLPAAQLNFLVARSKTELSRWGETILSPWWNTWEKPACSSASQFLIQVTWVEFLLRNFETKGHTGELGDGCGCAIQGLYLVMKSGSPDINIFCLRIYFRSRILFRIAKICLGRLTAPKSFLPIMWYTHILLASPGTSWFSQ